MNASTQNLFTNSIRFRDSNAMDVERIQPQTVNGNAASWNNIGNLTVNNNQMLQIYITQENGFICTVVCSIMNGTLVFSVANV